MVGWTAVQFFHCSSVPMILVGSNLCNVLLITVEHLEVIGMHSLSLKMDRCTIFSHDF